MIGFRVNNLVRGALLACLADFGRAAPYDNGGRLPKDQ